jgi:hypothetical protein
MRLSNTQFAIGAVRDYRLTWFKLELPAIELHRNYLRLERHQAGDTANFGIGLTIGPCPETRVTDVVVAAEPLVRTERLVHHLGLARTHRHRHAEGTSGAQNQTRRGLRAARYPQSLGRDDGL